MGYMNPARTGTSLGPAAANDSQQDDHDRDHQQYVDEATQV